MMYTVQLNCTELKPLHHVNSLLLFRLKSGQAMKVNKMGFHKTLTPSQLTLYWPPIITINETDLSSQINLAYLKFPRW